MVSVDVKHYVCTCLWVLITISIPGWIFLWSEVTHTFVSGTRAVLFLSSFWVDAVSGKSFSSRNQKFTHTHKQTRVRAHSCVHCAQIIYFLLSSAVMKCHQQTPHVQTCILIISFFTDEYTCAHTVTCLHTHAHTTNTEKHTQKPYSLL